MTDSVHPYLEEWLTKTEEAEQASHFRWYSGSGTYPTQEGMEAHAEETRVTLVEVNGGYRVFTETAKAHSILTRYYHQEWCKSQAARRLRQLYDPSSTTTPVKRFPDEGAVKSFLEKSGTLAVSEQIR